MVPDSSALKRPETRDGGGESGSGQTINVLDGDVELSLQLRVQVLQVRLVQAGGWSLIIVTPQTAPRV